MDTALLYGKFPLNNAVRLYRQKTSIKQKDNVMNKIVEALCVSLDGLAKQVTDQWIDDRTYLEAFGWNCPAVTRHDLATLATQLATRIRASSPESVDESLLKILQIIPSKIELLKAHTVPQIPSGNAAQAVSAYFSTLQWISDVTEPLYAWQTEKDPKLMPPQLAKRLRSLRAEIDQITSDKEPLKEQIQLIKEATEAAENLPTDMKALLEAKEKVQKYSNDALVLFSKIDERNMESKGLLDEINSGKEKTDKLVEKCEEAYKITTTKGLAAAFDKKASSLSLSVWAWVVGLLVALYLGATIGTQRIDHLTSAISDKTNVGLISLHVVLALLSIGAPVWFAWLSTKQIGQRFRLAEDYAFKASVAKAYEGYRREAERIDPELEARLFSSALDRLEEAPLRLVEDHQHGSPLHEFANSSVIKEAMSSIPGFANRVIAMAEDGVASISKRKAQYKPEVANESD